MLFIFVDNVYLLIFVVMASLDTNIRINCTLPIPEDSYVYWQKRVSYNSFVYLPIKPTKYVGLNTKSLSIHHLVYDDTGSYRCTKYFNSQHNYGQWIEITVTGKPFPFVYKIQDAMQTLFDKCIISFTKAKI
jgi:hypothetical protein